MTDVNDYRLEMENKLDDLNRQIMECRIRVNTLEEQHTREFYKHLEEFEAQQREIKAKLQHLDELESGARAELKTYLDSTFRSLRENLEVKLAPYVEEK